MDGGDGRRLLCALFVAARNPFHRRIPPRIEGAEEHIEYPSEVWFDRVCYMYIVPPSMPIYMCIFECRDLSCLWCCCFIWL